MTVAKLPGAAFDTWGRMYDPGTDSPDFELLEPNERTILLGYFAACAHAKRLLEAARKGGEMTKFTDVFVALSAAEAWLIDNGYRTYLPSAVNVSPYVQFHELVLRDLIAVRRPGERAMRYCQRFRQHVERLLEQRRAA
jgi:hypothetical protein